MPHPARKILTPSTLRQIYTGPNLILNLLFMLLFCAPLVVKGAALSGLGEGQHRIVNALNQAENIELAIDCGSAEGAITGTIMGKPITVPCRSEPMWKLLLGFGGPAGQSMPILTAILVVYQIARYLLTRQISLMRDAEERSGISPPKDGRFAYPMLYRVHLVLRFVFWIATAAFAVRAYEFLLGTVILSIG